MVVKGGYWGSTGSIGGIQRPSWTGSRAGSPRNGLAGAHGCCRSGRVRRLPPAEPRALRAQGAGLLAPCKPRGGAAYLFALRIKLHEEMRSKLKLPLPSILSPFFHKVAKFTKSEDLARSNAQPC